MVSRIKNKEPTFEVTNNDKMNKYYFDIDIKLDRNDWNEKMPQIIINKALFYINFCFKLFTNIKPNIAIADSSKKEYKGDGFDKGLSKYSLRFFVSNIIGYKSDIIKFVIGMNKTIKSKFDSSDNIYDYIEENNEGLFDESIYDKNRKMRCINTCKPNENDRPLCLLHGTIEQTIITNLFDKDTIELIFEKEKSSNSISSVEIEKTKNTNDKYIDLLFNVIGNGRHINFNTWFQIVGILKCNNYNFDILNEYTNIYDNENPKTLKIWDGINADKPMSIYGLQTIAKRENTEKYFEWLKKNEEFITIDILKRGANDICKYISKILKDKLVYSKGIWLTCNKNNLWIEINDPAAIIISEIQIEIDKLLKIRSDELIKETSDDKLTIIRNELKNLGEIRKQTNNEMNSYAKLLKTYLLNDEFGLVLDTNKYEIAYKNGILNLTNLSFRKDISPSDFLTKTIPFDYVISSEKDKTDIKEHLKKICNNNEIHLEYYLSILGYTMTGDASRLQEFYYLLGQKACNGKSVIFEALCDIMPNYFLKMGNDVFEKKNSTRHKEIARWRGIRGAWANELTTKEQDAEFLKEISDGSKISYKGLYKNADDMPITFKTFVISNHTFTINIDEGVKRRMRVAQFDSEFVSNLLEDEPENCRFKRDNSFGIKLRNDYKHSLLGLIFDYSKKFVDDNYQLKEYPDEWKEQNEIISESDNSFKDWFENNFELNAEYSITEYKLKQILKNNKFDIKFIDENKKNKWNFKREKVSKLWFGFRENINNSIE
jgi:hypothetical protein